MRLRVTPAIRLSLGLVILTLSILILAQALGLTSNSEQKQLTARQEMAETLALQVMLAVNRNDQQLLQSMLNNTVERNPEVTSVAVRQQNGGIAAGTSKHAELWESHGGEKSTPTNIYVPLIMNGMKRGALEMTLLPLGRANNSLFGLPSFVALALFVCALAFVGFWLFIKRALHHLDPSAVIPARVRNALNILAEGVLILDRREHIVLVNSTLTERLQSSERLLIGRKASSLGWQRAAEEASDLPWLSAAETGQRQVGVRLKLKQKGGKELIFRVNAVPILDHKGVNQGTIASFDDVSELEEKNHQLEEMVNELGAVQRSIEEKNRKLEYLASRDPMTDCYNRRALREKLDLEFDSARTSGSELVCIMTDIDHFKQVNDTYGHGLGDDIIKLVAATIKGAMRDSDIVSRFGGEEFCAILPNTDIEQAQLIAERCREKIAEQNCSGVKVTSSFGIASTALGVDTPNKLIQKADEALYASKENGRNQVSVWHPSMQNQNSSQEPGSNGS